MKHFSPDLYFDELIARIKAMHMWFYSAHHVAKGAGFAGDHELLFSEIYEMLDEHFDAVVERAIGLSCVEDSACPKKIAENACAVLCCWPSPTELKGKELSSVGSKIIGKMISCVEKMHSKLESIGLMTLGLDDMLGGIASDYEVVQYKLLQRTKSSRTCCTD